MMAQEVGGGVSEVGSIGDGVSVGEKCRMADGGVVGNGGGLGLGDLPRSGLVQAYVCYVGTQPLTMSRDATKKMGPT
jgi:hypothetical protein